MLNSGNTAERIRMLFFCVAVEKHRRMAWVCHGVMNTVTQRNQIGIGCRRIQRQQGGPGFHQRHNAFRDFA
ncbi:hypothetical protein D3C86_2194150 [compost metagenome]